MDKRRSTRAAGPIAGGGRFLGTEAYYSRYRRGYPQSLIARVVSLVGLSGSSRILDLGCGPGTLAGAFAPFVGQILGLDPEPGMIEEGRQTCRFANVRLELGSSFDLSSAHGVFDFVAIGRAFHWMDRDNVLTRLDRMIRPGGALGLFSAPQLKTEENRWREDFDRVVAAYAPEENTRLARLEQFGGPSHETVLLRSAFSRLERIGVVVSGQLPIDDAVGRAFSMGGTSPAALGARTAAFEAKMRAALEPHARAGRLNEISEPQALIAHRP